MTPYYTDEKITLYHGDLRDIVPELGERFSLCIADPPYGIGETGKAATGSRSSLAVSMCWRGDDYDAQRWEGTQMGVIRTASQEQVIWGGNYYTDQLPPSASWLVWDKVNGATDFADVELAWTSHKSAARLNRYQWHGMLQEPGQPREPRIYPGQKPVALMRWVLSLFAKPGDTILDPCCGSGPTLRACKEMGYRAVGIDISEQALELTARRLSQEVLAL